LNESEEVEVETSPSVVVVDGTGGSTTGVDESAGDCTACDGCAGGAGG
jgi:hypothetical protein